MKPSTLCNLGCFVDADFAGSWTLSTSKYPSSVKSHMGYVITFAAFGPLSYKQKWLSALLQLNILPCHSLLVTSFPCMAYFMSSWQPLS
jgi:hypothetical protein